MSFVISMQAKTAKAAIARPAAVRIGTDSMDAARVFSDIARAAMKTITGRTKAARTSRRGEAPRRSPEGQTGLEKVIFCLFGRDSYEVFANQLKQEISK